MFLCAKWQCRQALKAVMKKNCHRKVVLGVWILMVWFVFFVFFCGCWLEGGFFFQLEGSFSSLFKDYRAKVQQSKFARKFCPMAHTQNA